MRFDYGPDANETETRIQALEAELNALKIKIGALQDGTKSVRDISCRLAVIEHRLNELTRTKELWGPRGWMILTVCLCTFFSFTSSMLTNLIQLYLNSGR